MRPRMCAPAVVVAALLAALDEGPEMLLEGVAVAAGQPDRITHRDASMLAGKLDDPQRQFRERPAPVFVAV